MMLPASLPAIRVAALATPILARPRRDLAAFAGPFVLIWTFFGLLAFLGDDILHHVVDATPWLAARPWLIEMAVVATAGAYQLAPLKRHSLDSCRHARAAGSIVTTPGGGLLRAGVGHALACLGNSWALMLLMFAEGFANLWWMVALTALMVYEATGRHGRWAAQAVGPFLFGLPRSSPSSAGGPRERAARFPHGRRRRKVSARVDVDSDQPPGIWPVTRHARVRLRPNWDYKTR